MSMSHARQRLGRSLTIFSLLTVLILLINDYGSKLSSGWSSSLGHSNAKDYGILATDHGVQAQNEIKMTKFLVHAPGFSVIENLYWQNHTWIVMTDQAWTVPQESFWVSYRVDSRVHPPSGQELSKVYGIRNPALSHQVVEKHMIGQSITWQDASEMTRNAVDLKYPMLLNNDDNFVNHYYHWVGEVFLGSWRIWSHLAWRTGTILPNFKTVAFTKQWSVEEAPEGSPKGDSWEDRAGANAWFTSRFFPGANVETRSTWEARGITNQLYRMPLVVLGDRGAGHNGPSSAYKPFGDVLRLPVSADYLMTLRDRLLEGYKHTQTPLTKKRPVVLYLERQDSNRRLNHEDHDRLVRAFEEMDEEGVIEFQLRRFTKDMSFQEQVATVAYADVFVAVHGNGLTHCLWMDPGSQKAVFEMQPASCTVTDYSPLAQAAGIQHYMVHETDFCKPEDCPKRGCAASNGINTPDIRVDPRIITDEIRKIFSE